MFILVSSVRDSQDPYNSIRPGAATGKDRRMIVATSKPDEISMALKVFLQEEHVLDNRPGAARLIRIR